MDYYRKVIRKYFLLLSNTRNGCDRYDTKLHPVVEIQFVNSGECRLTPSLLLLLGPL